MQVIVSDVTYMGHEICVAGWYADERRMVRPLSGVGHHWPRGLAGPDLFCMGNIIELEPVGIPNTRGLPHSREDLVVRGQPKVVETISGDELAEALSDSESSSISDLFAGCLTVKKNSKAYVTAGSDCQSLGAVQVSCDSIDFYEDPWDEKLRCRVTDSDGSMYDSRVVSVLLRDLHSANGLLAVSGLLESTERAHVRIGLAHPFDSGEAYAMFNGLALY